MGNIEWVSELEHCVGVAAVLAASRRKLSVVDCVSFEIMRRLGINSVFCFDSHFEEEGFLCIPVKKKTVITNNARNDK